MKIKTGNGIVTRKDFFSMSKYFLFVCILMVSFEGFSQDSVVLRGRVTDEVNQVPLVGASVFLKHQNTGTTTDKNGYYSLNKQPGKDSLVVSFVGYNPKNLIVDGSGSLLNIFMEYAGVILNDVVVTAFSMNDRINKIPGSVSVLAKMDLRRDNNTSIVPALNRVPGVLMQSGALNTNRLTIRGIGSRSPFSTSKIRAYFDNIPLTTGDGETTIEDIDIDLVSRTEVLRGPSSSIYGAGLGGTLLLQPSFASSDPTQISTGIVMGSYGLLKSNSTFWMPVKSGGGVGLTYNYLHSDGYRENNEYDRSNITLTGRTAVGDKGTLSLLLTHINLKAFIPSSIDSATYASDPRAAAPTWGATQGFEDYGKTLAGLNYSHSISRQFDLDAALFAATRSSHELRPFNILEEESVSAGIRSIGNYHSPSEKIALNLGFEYFNEAYDWQTFENNSREKGSMLADNQENRWYLNVFGQVQVQVFNKGLTTFGINVNNTSYTLEDRFQPDSTNQSGSYGFDPVVSPRLAITYPIGNANLYGVISHGFSPPSFSETLAPNGLINPDIKPETGINYEMGVKGSISNKLQYDVSVYTMQIENLIVARRVMDDQFIGINAGKTAHNGLEMNIQYLIHSRVSGLNLVPFLSYTYAHYKFVEFVDGDNDYSGNELTGVPDHLFNLGIDFDFESGIFGNLNYHYVGKMPMRDDNSIYSDAYGITGMKAGWKKDWNKFRIRIYGGIDNIFDVKYASMIQINAPSFRGRAPRYYYPGLPVNYYGGIRLGYNLGKG